MELAELRGTPKSLHSADGDAQDFASEFQNEDFERTTRRNRRICGVVTAFAMAMMFVVIVVSGPGRGDERQVTEAGEAGAVSTSHHLATEAGIKILEAGGNAVDAAVAIQFMLGVVQPMSTGIGGGFYALVFNAAKHEVRALDAREEAPARFHPNIFCAGHECLQGPSNCTCEPADWGAEGILASGLSVGVPGTMRGLERMLVEEGSMSMAQVVAPAVKVAREGFEVSEGMELSIDFARDALRLRDATSELYLNEDRSGPKKKAGETMANPDLAEMMEYIARVGVDDFYEGALADEIVETVNNSPNPDSKKDGVMAKDDLRGYKAVWRRPVQTEYRGNHVFGMGSSSGGGISLAMMLNFLEGIDMSAFAHNSAEFLHHLLDAQNAAYADRNRYLGDEDFVDIPSEARHAEFCAAHSRPGTCPLGCTWRTGSGCTNRGLTTKEYGTQRRQNLSDATQGIPLPVPFGAFSSRYNLEEEEEVAKPGTAHFSVADRWGNIVSLTSSIENAMGSGIVVPGRGFLLNNELTDFSFDSSTLAGKRFANRPEGGKRPRRTALHGDSSTLGGKRPRSSMTPTIVFKPDMSPYIAVGSNGTVINVLAGIIDGGLDPSSAIAAPRAKGRNLPAELETQSQCHCERSLSENPELYAELVARGFEIEPPPAIPLFNLPSSFAQTIVWTDEGKAVAYPDPRWGRFGETSHLALQAKAKPESTRRAASE